MDKIQTIELPIAGMDCAECTQHVQHAITSLSGVKKADVFLSSEKAIVQLDPSLVRIADIRAAVKDAGYSIPEQKQEETATQSAVIAGFSRRILTIFGLALGAIVILIVAGEWLGLLDNLTKLIPFPVGVVLVLLGGAPIFMNVIRATLKRQVISHTLMSIGAFAAIL